MFIIFSKKTIFYSIIIFTFFFLIIYYYYGIFKFKYTVPPGDDGIRHMTEAKYIIQEGSYTVHPGSADPPLFHILLAILTYFVGEHLVTITKFFAPFLTILSISSIYFITKRYFGKNIALISFLTFAFISPNLFGIYEDGTYLDLISAEFFLVFMLSFLPILFKTFNKNILYKNVLLIIIFAGSTILSHSLSTVYLIMILGIFLILLVYWFFINIKNRKRIAAYTLLIYLSILAFLLFTWDYYLKGALGRFFNALNLVKISPQTFNNVIGDDIYFSLPSAFNGYVKAYSLIIILLATGGFICLILSFIFKIGSWQKIINLFKPYNKLINFNFDNNITSSNKNNLFEKIILIIWGGILIIGSRFSFFMFPSRLLGDATIPVCIVAAIFIYFLIILQKNSLRKKIIISLFVVFISFFAVNKTIQAFEYQKQIRVQKSDEKAITWINHNTKPDDIILAVPRTIVASGWGSYINLLTERKTLDGTVCPKGDDKECDPIYNPTSQISINYYLDNSIDYVYAGKKIMGEFVWKDKIDWGYKEILLKTPFLKKIVEFNENKELGSVVIFKVDQNILDNLIKIKPENK